MKNRDKDCIEKRIKELLDKMTLREKVALLAGKDDWSTAPVERLGIPSFTMSDGPYGVRTTEDGKRMVGATTAFPTGTAMASSWNTPLVERAAGAIGDEARAMGCDMVLGPCVNIIRHPLAGRNFETFSEDPHLAGQMAEAFINGLQNRGIGASLKHFACNSQEFERSRGSSVVDERTLREIYLPAFETAVKKAAPWTVMCSYNRINGVYASENRYLLNDILREEWGFDGAVISDWGAVHSAVESLDSGLDLEMPGPSAYRRNLSDEVSNWQISEETINRSAARILKLVLFSGKLDGSEASSGAVNTPEHQELARKLAEESMVLLKNEGGVLPLNLNEIKSIAVLGPNAEDFQIGGGGSSAVDNTPYRICPLDALRERITADTAIGYEEGCINYIEPPFMHVKFLTPPDGSGKGLLGEYYDNLSFSGEPVFTRVDTDMNMWWGGGSPCPAISSDGFSVRWSGKLTVKDPGEYIFKVFTFGTVRIYIDGVLKLDFTRDWQSVASENEHLERVLLENGKGYDIRMEYVKSEKNTMACALFMFGISPETELDSAFGRAVKLAASSDAAVVFAGMARRLESEGHDRQSLELPSRQNELISAVAKVNPHTVVVLNSGAPVAMSWISEVSAVLQANYPGMEGGNAVADILTGRVNPSGKLPVTYPKRIEDTPAYLYYPGGKEVVYGEGVFVGYRYYDKRDMEPLFPFGYGLSYTSFEYSKLEFPAKIQAGQTAVISLTVGNTGGREGAEVVQLYIHDRLSGLPRPPKELKAFAKVFLKPGESKRVDFRLDDRAFSYYDPCKKSWAAEPGEFELQVGSSSRDIRLIGRLELLP